MQCLAGINYYPEFSSFLVAVSAIFLYGVNLQISNNRNRQANRPYNERWRHDANDVSYSQILRHTTAYDIIILYCWSHSSTRYPIKPQNKRMVYIKYHASPWFLPMHGLMQFGENMKLLYKTDWHTTRTNTQSGLVFSA